jgi:hypothetical protein
MEREGFHFGRESGKLGRQMGVNANGDIASATEIGNMLYCKWRSCASDENNSRRHIKKHPGGISVVGELHKVMRPIPIITELWGLSKYRPIQRIFARLLWPKTA